MAATVANPKSELNLVRSAAAGAGSLVVIYVLCWIGAYFDLPVTHMWIEGFTFAPVDSTTALVEGTLWSLVAGAIVGATGAFFYNLFGVRSRR